MEFELAAFSPDASAHWSASQAACFRACQASQSNGASLCAGESTRIPDTTRNAWQLTESFVSSRSAAQVGLHRVGLGEGAFHQWPERGERGAVPETS